MSFFLNLSFYTISHTIFPTISHPYSCRLGSINILSYLFTSILKMYHTTYTGCYIIQQLYVYFSSYNHMLIIVHSYIIFIVYHIHIYIIFIYPKSYNKNLLFQALLHLLPFSLLAGVLINGFLICLYKHRRGHWFSPAKPTVPTHTPSVAQPPHYPHLLAVSPAPTRPLLLHLHYCTHRALIYHPPTHTSFYLFLFLISNHS